MKEYFQEYSIGEVAKAVGISPELVRYYEKIGLIESIKNDINRYRKFDLGLIESLGNIVMLRSLDLSLDAIAEIQSTYDSDLAVAEYILRAKAEEHRRDLEKLKHRLAITEVLEADLKRIRKQNGGISIVDSPDLIFFGLSDTLDSRDLAIRYNRLIHENNRLPRFTFVLDVEELSGEKPWLSRYTQFAVSIEADDISQEEGTLLPGSKCAYSTFVGHGVEAVKNKYDQMLQWIRKQGYVPGDRAIEVGNLNIGSSFLLEIYIPVK